MKTKGPKQKAETSKETTALEDVKKKLKKKELQTNILKKIIGDNDLPETKPFK